ncbi:MAG: hypothetical protein IT288_02270 [Bdellovibrionales bacterium]|nr:hypothetical protein [Bdellovibrionales bacterium]
MVRWLLGLTLVFSAISASADAFSFAGHVTLKNDVPVEIQLTLFEGDFQAAPDDEDTAAIVGMLAAQGLKLDTKIYFSLKDEKPNLLIMLVSKGADQSILIIDLEKQESFLYNVSELSPGRIVSRKAGFSDYILEVK